MFKNIGNTLKILSRILFVLALGAGVIMLLSGLLKVMKHLEYTSFSEAFSISEESYLYGRLRNNKRITEPYEGVLMIKASLLIGISSIAALPMYAFGVVVENIRALVKHQEDLAQKLDRIFKETDVPEQEPGHGMKSEGFKIRSFDDN